MDANVNPEGVLEEAKYFGIDSMIPILEEIICDSEKEKDQDMPLTRSDDFTMTFECLHLNQKTNSYISPKMGQIIKIMAN